MVVYALGSDSGFGIGHDGIIDDYDDESGISVILWCIIFVFLLIVTIWFYVTQLMPNRGAKCEIDDEEDEDERVANRLLDPRTTKTINERNYELPTCEPSTSSENTDDYEVIDGEIRIHYSNYEREKSTNSNDGNSCEPKETSMGPRRHSMEEMSLIFPGFLPSISEEEEEFDENIDLNIEGNVYKSCNDKGDTCESNANIFMDQEFSSRSNKLGCENRDSNYKTCNGTTARASSNRKGKQPVGNATTEMRRRNFHTEKNTGTPDSQALWGSNLANESYVRDSELGTAAEKLTRRTNESNLSEQTSLARQNKIHDVNVVSGSKDCDPNCQNISNISIQDQLIIAKESTVALETLSPDANENINRLDLTSDDNRAVSASTESSLVTNENVEEENDVLRKSSEIEHESVCLVSGEDSGYDSHSKDNDLVSTSSENSTKNMTDHLTHAWTFYSMDDTNRDLTVNPENIHQHQEIPQIMVSDLHHQETSHVSSNSGNISEKLSYSLENIVDSFETDIDVDDIDLDDLHNAEEGHFNCFFKRHVSVTDLDKILSSQDITNDGAKHYKEESDDEKNVGEIVSVITDPVGNLNKQNCSLKSRDNITMNDSTSKTSRSVMTDELVSKKTMTMDDRVSSKMESTTGKYSFNGVVLEEKSIKTDHEIQLASTQQNSNTFIDTPSKYRKGEQSLDNLLKHDVVDECNVDKKEPEMFIHEENYSKTLDKNYREAIPTVASENASTAATIKRESNIGDNQETNGKDFYVVDRRQNMNCQVENMNDRSSVDANLSNVKINKADNEAISKAKDEKKVTISRLERENVPDRSSLRGIRTTEKKVGLTADELKSTIDLSRPPCSSSRDEIIIGKKKQRNDSGTRSYMSIMSRNPKDVAKDTEGEPVTQSKDIRELQDVKENIDGNKPDDFAMDNNVHLTSKETGRPDQGSKLTNRCQHKETDTKLQYHVEMRPVSQRPTIEKSVFLIPEKSELQTLIKIKDIPDTKIGLEITTNRSIDSIRQNNTQSTGLEIAEQIVASRLKRLESERKNSKVHEDITYITSNDRQIDWSNVLVDGLSLDEVNTENKARDFEHDDIVITPPPCHKKTYFENEVTERVSAQTLSSKGIDWEWFDRDIYEKKSAGDSIDKAVKTSAPFVDRVHLSNDGKESRVSQKIEKDVPQEKNKTFKANDKQTIIEGTDPSSNSDRYNKKGIKSADEKVDKLPVDTNTELKSTAKNSDFNDDKDVFSKKSRPCPEPDFPVRLTKSFSELRDVSLLSQSRSGDTNFGRADRSKSQTEIFDPQEAHDDVFEDPEEHVFTTRITVDEVYKNKRRIVVMNIRKKSPGRTRWKSLNDLESAKKHVFKFTSIGSLSEEDSSAGVDSPLSTTKDKDGVLTENKEAALTVSGRRYASSGDLHDNDVSSKERVFPSCKQTTNQAMDAKDFDLDYKSRDKKQSIFDEQNLLSDNSSSNPSDGKSSTSLKSVSELTTNKIETIVEHNKLQQSTFETIEQSLLKDDRLSTLRKVDHELIEPKVLHPAESAHKSVFQEDQFFNTDHDASDLKSPTDSEIVACLTKTGSDSPVQDLPKQDSNRRSPGTVFAVSRYSPSLPASSHVKASLKRQSSLSPTLESSKQESSVPSSGTLFTARRHSPTPLRDAEDEPTLQRQSSLSPVKDMAKQGSNRRSSSGTLFAVSRHSPTPLKDPDSEIKLSNRSWSPGTTERTLSPVPLADSDVKNAIQRQSSSSPVKDIKQPTSPSGRMFARSRKSPTPQTDSKTEKYVPRQSSLSPVQDVFKRNSPRRSSGTIFAVSRHSPTPLSEADYMYGKISPTGETAKDPNDATHARSEVHVHQYGSTKIQSCENLEKKPYSVEPRLSPRSGERIKPQTKCDKEGILQRQSSLSPELNRPSHDSSSRRSSASSGYGGSRISPTSSLDWRHKISRPSTSPELVPEERNSRHSSASSRISPTPSTDSECSNIDSTKRQKGSRRSGRVFAISGYSSATSDTEPQRPGSVSPRENRPKRSVQSTDKDVKLPTQSSRGEAYVEGKPFVEKSEHRLPEPTPEGFTSSTNKTDKIINDVNTKSNTSAISRRLSSDTETEYKITNDGWLVKGYSKNVSSRTNDRQPATARDRVMVTDLDSLLSGTNSPPPDTEIPPCAQQDDAREATHVVKTRASNSAPSGVQETDLDAIFTDSDSSSSREDKNGQTLQSAKSSRVDTTQRSKMYVAASISTVNKHTVQVQSHEASVYNTSPYDDRPVFDDFDENIFTKLPRKSSPRSRDNTSSFSSDADSETSSINSLQLKSKTKHTRSSLQTVKYNRQRMSPSSESSLPVTPSTPDNIHVDPDLPFLHPDLTSTPDKVKAVGVTTTFHLMSKEAAKEPRHEGRQDSAQGNILLTDSTYGAALVKTRSKSESRTISTFQGSAFTPVQSHASDRRSISQEYILDGLPTEHQTPNQDNPTFKDMADSHKSLPDLHKAHENIEIPNSPEKKPYHSRLSAHTRLWLSQTAGIDTSDLCKDESIGSEIFLLPSRRFQPGKNVDASFLSIASETEDVPDDVSSRASSPMSEFSFSGESPFGGKFDDELNIITCGHHLCGEEEVIRGHEKTSFTSCPSCYTYYCSRECRQAHWREHKKSCYFGRINSYMRSFIYFCHKKENLKLLLSNIATKNYASKGRGCVMVTFASPKQARKFMTSGCVLLPSPPSYPTVRELMREGVVSKHKVNLVHLVKDYNPSKEFVLNLAVVAGRLEDLPRNPVPRHKLNTVLQCIKVPLSDSVIEPPKSKVPDTRNETRVFYLPKCSRHEFINDMEARRHYCRNISKGLKSYGIRLKKDYPDAYESLCLYVEKNIPFKPLTVYGNEGSKIIACRIMPEASISAV